MKENNSKEDEMAADLSAGAGKGADQELANQIQLLVDNELTSDERSRLFAKLDQSTSGWKQCAIAFCNEQFLQQEFEQLDKSSAIVPETPSPAPEAKKRLQNPKPSLNAALALAVVLVVGLGIGLYMGTTSTRPNDHSVASAEQTSVRSMVQEAKDLVRENKTAATIPVDLPITRLFELENNEKRAVYLSPDPLPDFILQSMVFAGHEVEVSREHIETAITAERTMSIPIYELTVTKNQQYSQVAKSY